MHGSLRDPLEEEHDQQNKSHPRGRNLARGLLCDGVCTVVPGRRPRGPAIDRQTDGTTERFLSNRR